METMLEFPLLRTKHSRLSEVDFNDLEFGRHVSDHMLVCDYYSGNWQRPHIVPYANLSLAPSTLCFHYGQTVFEGMKAFRMKDGRINIFRLERHYERFVRSMERMCMPPMPATIFKEGLIRLVTLDGDWIPRGNEGSLYIRPMVIATESKFGVKASEEYRFVIFTGPVPMLFRKPIKVKVELNYVRASRGGTGAAKCGGNYGGAFYPTMMAREEGYDQVLWTDAAENKYIEESGMMNVMFVIDNTLVTPPLSDTILDGITRECLLLLAADLGYKTEQRRISVQELQTAFKAGNITEAFGTGTAAVVANIGTINIRGEEYHLPVYNEQSLSYKLAARMQSIRFGTSQDMYHWNFII